MSVCACVEHMSEAELLARLDEEIAEKREMPGALIPVLQFAQSLFGYLPENVLKRISSDLHLSYSEVAGVVCDCLDLVDSQPRSRRKHWSIPRTGA